MLFLCGSALGSPYVALRWASRLTPVGSQTLAGIGDALFQLSLCDPAVGISVDPSRLSTVGGLGVPWVAQLPRASLQNEVVDIPKERPITCGVLPVG